MVFLISNIVSSQVSCNNLDFEKGNFNSWEGETGICCPEEIKNPGINEGRHTIMTGNAMDPNTCGNVPVVAPGGLFSARLGNDKSGKETETLSYTLDITEANSLFIYKYAVVLQDPGHDPSDQPYFNVAVYNENKELVDAACGSYNVIASSDVAGFQTCETYKVVYKNWSTVGLNLSPYIGQKITVAFKTRDCAIGEHYGYAYIDAYCSSLKIASTYCSNANGVTLTAPIGFRYYWNTGETTQSIKIDNPIDGTKYTCKLASVTNCIVDIATVLVLKDPVIYFEAINTCDKKEVVFNNTTLYAENTGNLYHWDFGDGTTSTDENPTHIFPSVGNYNVTFGFTNSLGCKFSITRSIMINVSPEPHLNGGTICLDSFGNLVKSLTLNIDLASNDFKYQWFFNGNIINDATQNSYVVVKEGEYSVLVTNIKTSCLNKAFATVALSKMASNLNANISEDFAALSSVNVEVVGGTGPFLYQLDDRGFQDSKIFNQLVAGSHLITVKDGANCTLISKQITIMTYPKFFTPNNDKTNNYWNIPNYDNLFEMQIYIFNRYGKFIKQINPKDRGWDGTFNGALMPSSDYWFILNYKEMDHSGDLKSRTFKAHFSLKR